MKEGLSIALDSHRLAEGLVDKEFTHMIDAPEEVVIVEENNIIHITIPKDTLVSIPITITTTYDLAGSCTFMVHSEKGSRAVINRYILEKNNHQEQGLVTERVEFSIEGDLSYNQAQALSTTTSYLCTKIGQVHGQMRLFDYVLGGDITQISTSLELYQDAQAKHFSALHLNLHQQTDISTVFRHCGQSSKSKITSRAVVLGEAKLLHRGLTIIEKNAQHSEGFQDFTTLIGEDGVADTIPKLEINTPEVLCSHGSSTGSVDEDQLHYLRSRGFSKKAAQDLITNSFLSGIVTMTKDSAWQADILSLLTAAQQDLQCMRCKFIKSCRCSS